MSKVRAAKLHDVSGLIDMGLLPKTNPDKRLWEQPRTEQKDIVFVSAKDGLSPLGRVFDLLNTPPMEAHGMSFECAGSMWAYFTYTDTDDYAVEALRTMRGSALFATLMAGIDDGKFIRAKSLDEQYKVLTAVLVSMVAQNASQIRACWYTHCNHYGVDSQTFDVRFYSSQSKRPEAQMWASLLTTTWPDIRSYIMHKTPPEQFSEQVLESLSKWAEKLNDNDGQEFQKLLAVQTNLGEVPDEMFGVDAMKSSILNGECKYHNTYSVLTDRFATEGVNGFSENEKLNFIISCGMIKSHRPYLKLTHLENFAKSKVSIDQAKSLLDNPIWRQWVADHVMIADDVETITVPHISENFSEEDQLTAAKIASYRYGSSRNLAMYDPEVLMVLEKAYESDGYQAAAGLQGDTKLMLLGHKFKGNKADAYLIDTFCELLVDQAKSGSITGDTDWVSSLNDMVKEIKGDAIDAMMFLKNISQSVMDQRLSEELQRPVQPLYRKPGYNERPPRKNNNYRD